MGKGKDFEDKKNGRNGHKRGGRQRGKDDFKPGDRSGVGDTGAGARSGNPGEGERTSTNDYRWYSRSPELTNAVGKLNFNYPAGLLLHTVKDPDWFRTGYGIDGIMCLNVMPAIGISEEGANNDPVNLAAQMIYSYVRHANSGSRNYSQEDLMMYILYVMNMFSYHAWVCRLYGLLQDYNGMNRYLPKQLCTLMGADYDDLIKHAVEMHYYINLYAKKVNTLSIPSAFTYLDRITQMYMHLYQDGESAKSQMYFYNPVCFYKYAGFDTDTGTRLTPVWIKNSEQIAMGTTYADNHLLTWSEIQAIGDELINAGFTDEDVGIMSGDIRKAYGDSNLVTLGALSESFAVDTVYDPIVMTQIQNAMCVGTPIQDTVYIEQDTEGLVHFNPSFWSKGYGYRSFDPLVTTFSKTVGVEELLDIGQLQVIVKNEVLDLEDLVYPGYAFQLSLDAASALIPLTYEMLYVSPTSNTNPTPVFYTNVLTNYIGDYANRSLSLGDDLEAVLRSMVFRFCPVYYIAGRDDGDTWKLKVITGQIDNYAVSEESWRRNLFETSLIAMFDVPNSPGAL